MNVPQVMKLLQLTHNLVSRSRSSPSPATSDKYLGFFIFLLARITTIRGEKVAYQRWKNILYVLCIILHLRTIVELQNPH